MRLRLSILLMIIIIAWAGYCPARADSPVEGYWTPSNADIAPLADEIERRLPAPLSHYHSYYEGVLINVVTVCVIADDRPSSQQGIARTTDRANGNPGPGACVSRGLHIEPELKAVFIPLAPGEKASVERIPHELPVFKDEGCMIGPWPSADTFYCNPPVPLLSAWPPPK